VVPVLRFLRFAGFDAYRLWCGSCDSTPGTFTRAPSRKTRTILFDNFLQLKT
jgi:hypothetical protein